MGLNELMNTDVSFSDLKGSSLQIDGLNHDTWSNYYNKTNFNGANFYAWEDYGLFNFAKEYGAVSIENDPRWGKYTKIETGVSM